MRRVILVSLITVSMGFMSCDKQEPEKAGHPAHESENPEVKVSLVNGQKWHSDAATNEGIGRMRDTVEAFAPDSDVESLKLVLDQQFVGILKQCTMQGEAHEQLHNYLLPLKSHFENMNNENKVKTLPELKAYLVAYWDYFGA